MGTPGLWLELGAVLSDQFEAIGPERRAMIMLILAVLSAIPIAAGSWLWFAIVVGIALLFALVKIGSWSVRRVNRHELRTDARPRISMGDTPEERMLNENAKWRRFYAALDRLIELTEPVRAAKDGQIIPLPKNEFERFKNQMEATVSQLHEAQKDLSLQSQSAALFVPAMSQLRQKG